MADAEERRFELRQAFELAAADCEHALESLTGVKGVKRIRAALERIRDRLDGKAAAMRRDANG